MKIFLDFHRLESALDLLAVGGEGELLGVLGVLGGGHHHGGGGEVGGEASVPGHGADLAGHTLHALLRLNNGLNKKFYKNLFKYKG